MIESKAITWPQIRDGKDGQIIKLFNVKGTPTYYVVDRAGRIAAKAFPGKELSAVISEALRK
jgi:hypothetical protein